MTAEAAFGEAEKEMTILEIEIAERKAQGQIKWKMLDRKTTDMGTEGVGEIRLHSREPTTEMNGKPKLWMHQHYGEIEWDTK
jgi:hypothetical protein